MRSIFLVLFVFGVSSVFAQGVLPARDIPTQNSTGFFEHGWHKADSGHVFAVRDTNFRPRYVGTTVYWVHSGVDTAQWVWTGRYWKKNASAVEVVPATWGGINGAIGNQTDLQNALLQKFNVTDTTNKWAQDVYARADSLFKRKNNVEVFIEKITGADPVWGGIDGVISNQTDLQGALSLKFNTSDTSNKWTQDVYARNDSLFKRKNNTEIFIDTLGGGGGGGPVNTRFSVTKGLNDSVQLDNDLTATPDVNRRYVYGFDINGGRSYIENKYVICKSFTDVRALNIPDTSYVFRLIIKGVVGDFYYDPADVTSIDDSAIVFVTTSGKRIKRYVENVVDARWFGANPVADGGDDYPFLQRAVDWCVKNRLYGTLYIPSGWYALSKGLLIQRDDNGDGQLDFVSLNVMGSKVGGNPGTGQFGNGGETVLQLTDSTDFCIGVNLGKTMTISNINFLGCNLTYGINCNNMVLPDAPWLLPGIRNNRYSPNCAVVIDPGRSGVPEENRYPLHPDAYTHHVNNGSTAVNVENCHIRGFAVGIANAPNGISQNAECHNFRHLWIEHVKSGIANCNSQARTIYCFDIKAWDAIEVVFDHLRYGDGFQSSAMYMENINVAGCVKWLIATTGWGIGYNHYIKDIHAELLYGIGGDIVNGTQLGNITIVNGQIDLTASHFDQKRAPVVAWCNILEFQNSFVGNYSQSDGTYRFVNAQAVIRKNCSGVPVLTQSEYDNTVFSIANVQDGEKERYFITQGGGITNSLAMKPGVELYKNAYLDFANTGLQLRQKYCGKGMYIYALVGSFSPINLDSTIGFTCKFKIGSGNVFRCPVGAQLVSLIPDDITGVQRLASLGIVNAISNDTISVHLISYKIHSTDVLPIYIYYKPYLVSNANFYIGDIVSGSPTITDIIGDFGTQHAMQVGQYFNHPAFTPGTYITATTSTTITLSSNALYSEVGGFVLNEASWDNTGLGGETQATLNSFFNKVVFKEGDIIKMGYANNSGSLDTNKLAFVCIKAGMYNTSRIPVFRPLYVNSSSISNGTAPPVSTPAKVGDIFVDMTNKKIYIATGTSSSADWTITN